MQSRPQDLVAPSPRAPAERVTRVAQPAHAAAATHAGGGTAGGGGGGEGSSALLDAAYDEEASAASFQAALRAWRGEPEPAADAGSSATAKPARETAEQIWERAQQAAASAGGASTGGAARAAAAAPVARAAPGPTPAAAVGTQAGTRSMEQMSFYERLQEQKRRDGVLYTSP